MAESRNPQGDEIMKRSVTYVWLGAAFLVGSAAQAQQDPVQPPNPLFTSYDVLELTIEAPFKKVFRERSQEPEQFLAVLNYQDGGEQVSLNLKVNTRGRFRLQKRTCSFPPIQLDLQKDSVAGTIFAGQNKIKLVTHCQSGRDQYEQYVLQEYLVYRAYSLFSDMSFRVRLAHITYVDNEEENDPLTKYAFLIEHKDDLAARTGWEILDLPQVLPDYFDQDNLNAVAVFQFLIGNTDISLFQAAEGETECCHNAKALGSMAGPVYSVPYDFDMAGIINTRYSQVSETLPIRNVRERFFRGRCVPPDQMERTLQVFQEQKDAVYALYMELPQLDEKVREKTIEYLDDFYEIIDDDRKVEREMVRDCRRI
jgi:hypothetical protein